MNTPAQINPARCARCGRALVQDSKEAREGSCTNTVLCVRRAAGKVKGMVNMMATPKPMKFDGHTVTLHITGFMSYVDYRCVRDADGAHITGGAIPRANYPDGPRGDAAHRRDIKAACMKVIKEGVSQ